MSVIGERVPLELLTHRPLSPAQLAEIQVFLSSGPVANFAFTFCHLVHWVAFGQTQRDATQDSFDGRAVDIQGYVDSYCSPNSSTAETVVTVAPQAPDSRQRSGQSEKQAVLNQVQHSLKGVKPPFAAEARCSPPDVDPNSAENILREEFLRLRRAEPSSSLLEGGNSSSSRVIRRCGVLQRSSQREPTGGVYAVETCEELDTPLNTCRKRMKVLAAAEAAYQDVMSKIKVCQGPHGLRRARYSNHWGYTTEVPFFFQCIACSIVRDATRVMRRAHMDHLASPSYVHCRCWR